MNIELHRRRHHANELIKVRTLRRTLFLSFLLSPAFLSFSFVIKCSLKLNRIVCRMNCSRCQPLIYACAVRTDTRIESQSKVWLKVNRRRVSANRIQFGAHCNWPPAHSSNIRNGMIFPELRFIWIGHPSMFPLSLCLHSMECAFFTEFPQHQLPPKWK